MIPLGSNQPVRWTLPNLLESHQVRIVIQMPLSGSCILRPSLEVEVFPATQSAHQLYWQEILTLILEPIPPKNGTSRGISPTRLRASSIENRSKSPTLSTLTRRRSRSASNRSNTISENQQTSGLSPTHSITRRRTLSFEERATPVTFKAFTEKKRWKSLVVAKVALGITSGAVLGNLIYTIIGTAKGNNPLSGWLLPLRLRVLFNLGTRPWLVSKLWAWVWGVSGRCASSTPYRPGCAPRSLLHLKIQWKYYQKDPKVLETARKAYGCLGRARPLIKRNSGWSPRRFTRLPTLLY